LSSDHSDSQSEIPRIRSNRRHSESSPDESLSSVPSDESLSLVSPGESLSPVSPDESLSSVSPDDSFSPVSPDESLSSVSQDESLSPVSPDESLSSVSSDESVSPDEWLSALVLFRLFFLMLLYHLDARCHSASLLRCQKYLRPGSGSKSSVRHQDVKLMHNYAIVINRSKLTFRFTLAILQSVLGLRAALV